MSVPQRHWTHTRLFTLPRKPPAATGQRRAGGPPGPVQPWAAPAQQCVCLLSIFLARLCGPGGTSMQGQPELGGAPGQVLPPSGSLSDLAEGAGEVSLHQASKDSGAGETPGAQSGDDVEWVRTRSQLPPTDGDAGIPGRSEGFTTCTTSGPDPGEHSGAWGEFEGFRESSAKSEQFSQSFGLPERPTEPLLPRTPSAQKERGSRQPHRGGPRVSGTATVPPSEVFLKFSSSPCCTGSVLYAARPADLRPWWAGQGRDLLLSWASCS